MKRIDWLILIVVIAIIISIALWSTASSEPRNPNEDKLSAFRRWLKELEHQIDDEVKNLKLTKEMKEFLDKKISRFLFAAKTVFLMVCASVYYLFYLNGLDLLNSL